MFYTAGYIGRYLVQKLAGIALRTRSRLVVKEELTIYLPVFGERTVGIFRRFVFLPLTIDLPSDVVGLIQRYFLDLTLRSFFCFGSYTSTAPRIWYLIRTSSLLVNIHIFLLTRRMLAERLFFFPTSNWSNTLFMAHAFMGLPIYSYTTYQLAFTMVLRLQKVYLLFREIQLCGFFLNNVCYAVDDLAEYAQRVSLNKVTHVFFFYRGYFCFLYALFAVQCVRVCFIGLLFLLSFFSIAHCLIILLRK